MKCWLVLLKSWGLPYSVLKTKAKQGERESTLEWESEVTEFIRSVGSEPSPCLWVSVALPVHVFSLSSGRPPSPQSLCQCSLIILALSSWFRFLSSADLVTAFRLVFLLLRGISLDWTVIKERLPRRLAYLTLSLFCWPLFLPFVAHICVLCQSHEFSSSNISPTVRSTPGLPFVWSVYPGLSDQNMSVEQFWRYLKPQFRLLYTKTKSWVGLRLSASVSYLCLCLQSSSVP